MLRQTRRPFLAFVLALALAVLPIASASAAPFSHGFGASSVDTADGGLFSWFVSLFNALLTGGKSADAVDTNTGGPDPSFATADSEESEDFGPQIDINGSV